MFFAIPYFQLFSGFALPSGAALIFGGLFKFLNNAQISKTRNSPKAANKTRVRRFWRLNWQMSYLHEFFHLIWSFPRAQTEVTWAAFSSNKEQRHFVCLVKSAKMLTGKSNFRNSAVNFELHKFQQMLMDRKWRFLFVQ